VALDVLADRERLAELRVREVLGLA
jgi:hypothetical protein